MFDDPLLGLYEKYAVYRPAIGEYHDHSLCDLFVIDLDHDPYASPVYELYLKEWERCHQQLYSGQDCWIVRRLVNEAKHKDCKFLVLDACHDRIAILALRAYRILCKDSYPLLGSDLQQMIDRHKGKYYGEEGRREGREPEVFQEEDDSFGGGEKGGQSAEAGEPLRS